MFGKHEGFAAIKSGLMFYNFSSAEPNLDLSNLNISKIFLQTEGKKQDWSIPLIYGWQKKLKLLGISKNVFYTFNPQNQVNYDISLESWLTEINKLSHENKWRRGACR